MQDNTRVTLRVWGDFACFTRPELKVERVSYPVITPSAARGLLEAIFWKPEFRYEVREIGVLQLGSQMAILRNEIDRSQGNAPIVIEAARQQRTSIVLRDVSYLIHADVVLRRHATDPVQKYTDQFFRRVERGQYHHTPSLGTREFAASFALAGDETPGGLGLQIGPMLFELAFIEDNARNELTFRRHGVDGQRTARGYTRAIFFDARLAQGWLRVPVEKYKELYGLEGNDV